MELIVLLHLGVPPSGSQQLADAMSQFRNGSYAEQPSVIALSFNALWGLHLLRRTVLQTSEFLNIHELKKKALILPT